ncbi:MAG: hypothetical protein K2X08_01765 [Chlamydiales bacterium]|nr:hypothetical protein [Chlamydiales bacterium]
MTVASIQSNLQILQDQSIRPGYGPEISSKDLSLDQKLYFIANQYVTLSSLPNQKLHLVKKIAKRYE